MTMIEEIIELCCNFSLLYDDCLKRLPLPPDKSRITRRCELHDVCIWHVQTVTIDEPSTMITKTPDAISINEGGTIDNIIQVMVDHYIK